MDRLDVLRPYVEKLLREILEIEPGEHLAIDEDGDYPIRLGNAQFYVRLVQWEPVFLYFFSPFLREVSASPELLNAINEINRATIGARVFWYEEALHAATELVAQTLDRDELVFACRSMKRCVEENASELAKRFEGTLAVPEDEAESEEVDV